MINIILGQERAELRITKLMLQRIMLTLYTPRVTYRFYSVLGQTILLVKGRPLRA